MDEIKKLVEQSKKNTKEIQKKYQIALVCNSRSKTRPINHQQVEFSDNNEFFSDEEYDEIFSAIQSSNFYVDTYFNELTFITKTLEESYFRNNKLVYNLSRNGSHVGKKSLIPSFCDLMGIPYTGSNAFVTSLCRAKYTYTKYLEAHNIATPKTWIYFGEEKWLNQEPPALETKVIIKPMHESASIGLDTNSVFVFDEAMLAMLEELYLSKKEPILLQKFIEGYECEIPLFISDKVYAMEPVGISINGKRKLNYDFLTYTHSYENNYGFYSLADELSASKIALVKEYALQIGKLTNLTNYGRIDFRITDNGDPYLIDIATSPYTIKHSSFAYSFNKLQLAYEDIYPTIINLAYQTFKPK
ncbi:ATP-grasp domain-containing protein [Brevibacillus parabrevis]|uniref:ATP-grasp domain-containing protein n=1 Tax=Brevibacillus parabrevis TaxID=54914 RepID=UPI001F6134CC|nr:ATP-grasp domain-containing protein [Brevibacillus parabrevis]MDR5000453.1 ATP-grasp domain-containing protein [Brevibacillus parabrevis]